MNGLVTCVLNLSVSKNMSEDKVRALIDEIFVANGVLAAQRSSHSGEMRRLDKIRVFQDDDGGVGFEW